MGKIVKREIDYAKWYTSIITEADLIDYGLAKGTLIFKPYGWQIWTNIKKYFTLELEKVNTQECCLPLMIPYSEFLKESKHVEGFNPELYKVSHIGNKKLEDELVVRPTSEIAFCYYFKKNVNSYNDLPCILNQWCNVFRVEKNTRPFLRTCEFFWQEQHAVFSNEKEAVDFAFTMIDMYKNFVKNFLSIHVLVGEKTENERFAGADKTLTIEAMMPDGQALQSATSHYLGTNFSKSFDIKYQNKNNEFDFVHQTSAGLSTRIIGAIIMSHSDDNGLVLPFKIAPIQFAVVSTSDADINKVNLIIGTLNKFRTAKHIVEKSIGLKLQENEIKGIPFQIIVGKKELETNSITIYRRDLKIKTTIKIDEFSLEYINKLIESYENNLYMNSKNRLENNIVSANNIDEFKKGLDNKKFILAYWSGSAEDEKKLKELTGATPRCYASDKQSLDNQNCFFTNKPNAKLVYFARSY